MSRVRSTNTAPEVFIGKALFSKGFRYRKNVRSLPGSPDLVFKKHLAVIFVNGCFWHGHKGCSKAKTPSTNSEFWKQKIEKNACRDQKNISLLISKGWRVMTVWTCSLTDKKKKAAAVEDAANWLQGNEPLREIPDTNTRS